MGKKKYQNGSQDFEDKSNANNSNDARNRRPNRNSRRKSKKTEVDISDSDINKADLKGVFKSKENDGSWYSHYPELVSSFGSIPFSYPLGVEVPIPAVSYTSTALKPGLPVVPGMMALDWYPTIGQAYGYAADPVNQAANKIYVYVRHVLSTYANYDASDMMLYILAMDSIYTLYSELVRVYGVALNWKVLNRYYARAMIEALGFDADSVLDNLAAFRGQINEIAYMLNQFVVPAGFDYITRHVWMAGNLFLDGEAAKSQTYFYRMGGFYEFVEVTDGPSYLRFTKRFSATGVKLTATQAISQLKRCISLIMNSQDAIAMSGDLLKAFGPSGTFVAIPVGENYIVEPTYSKEVLSQFENATILGYPYENGSPTDPWNGNIKQTTTISAGPNIQQNIKIGIAQGSLTMNLVLMQNWLLNFHTNDVSPIDVMIATRLTNIAESFGQWPLTGAVTSYIANFSSLGSEVLASVIAFYYSWDTDSKNYRLSFQELNRANASFSGLIAQLWSIFDWAPRIYALAGAAPTYDIYPMLDIDNYAILSHSDLKGLHSTALMSLFEVPAIAKLSVKKFETRKTD